MKYKITFLGSKGMIEESSPHHKLRTSIIVETRKTRFQIDCGEEAFFDKLKDVDFLYVSHTHSDHVSGLKHKEIPTILVCTSLVRRQLIRDWKAIPTSFRRPPFKRGDVSLKAVSCFHSIRCPMWGVVINDEVGIFTDIIRPRIGWGTLRNLRVYIGDGSAINRPIIRVKEKGGEPFGHTSMKSQLRYASQLGWKKVIFTHLGRQPVLKGDTKVKEILEREDLTIARDGLSIEV